MLDFFLLHSFLCKEHKNQNDDMTFCVVYTETCVSLQLVTTKSVWKYRTEWNFEKRISDSGPSKHAWILVYSSRIKFYSHPQNPGNVPCKLHEKPCKVHGFRCSLHTSRTCTYWQPILIWTHMLGVHGLGFVSSLDTMFQDLYIVKATNIKSSGKLVHLVSVVVPDD